MKLCQNQKIKKILLEISKKKNNNKYKKMNKINNKYKFKNKKVIMNKLM